MEAPAATPKIKQPIPPPISIFAGKRFRQEIDDTIYDLPDAVLRASFPEKLTNLVA